VEEEKFPIRYQITRHTEDAELEICLGNPFLDPIAYFKYVSLLNFALNVMLSMILRDLVRVSLISLLAITPWKNRSSFISAPTVRFDHAFRYQFLFETSYC
jgi:hypothetical protein